MDIVVSTGERSLFSAVVFCLLLSVVAVVVVVDKPFNQTKMYTILRGRDRTSEVAATRHQLRRPHSYDDTPEHSTINTKRFRYLASRVVSIKATAGTIIMKKERSLRIGSFWHVFFLCTYLY